MKSIHLHMKIGEAPLVPYEVIGPRKARIAPDLRSHDGAHLLLAIGIARHGAGELRAFVHVHYQHAVGERVLPRFQQQGRDQQHVGGGGGLKATEDLDGDTGVEKFLEPIAVCRVGENALPELRPVERPIRSEDALADELIVVLTVTPRDS